MGRRVQCGLKQRQEQVPQELSEILQQVLLPVDVTAEELDVQCVNNKHRCRKASKQVKYMYYGGLTPHFKTEIEGKERSIIWRVKQ